MNQFLITTHSEKWKPLIEIERTIIQAYVTYFCTAGIYSIALSSIVM